MAYATLLQVRETLHCTPMYYDKGPWYDFVKAKHRVPAKGPARRLPKERSRVQKEGRQQDEEGWEETEDVALIQRLLFCQIPATAAAHAGEWHPMIMCRWMRYCDAWNHMVYDEGEGASMQRIQHMLEEMGVETVEKDPHEWPIMLHIDQVCSIVYYQHGSYDLKPRVHGKPDFFWVDTLWDTM